MARPRQGGFGLDGAVCHLDLLLTLCAIAGTKLPERQLDGADLTPLFDGKTLKRPHPLYWQYDFAISRPWVVSLRDGAWKLLADAELKKFELYDLVDDVGESKNLADKEPERVKRMAAEMKRLNAEVQADGARSGNPSPGKPRQ
jgi:arylsulfatase A